MEKSRTMQLVKHISDQVSVWEEDERKDDNKDAKSALVMCKSDLRNIKNNRIVFTMILNKPHE